MPIPDTGVAKEADGKSKIFDNAFNAYCDGESLEGTDVESLIGELRNCIEKYADTETPSVLGSFKKQVRAVRSSNTLNSLFPGMGMPFKAAGRGKFPCQPTCVSRRKMGMPRGASPLAKGRRRVGSIPEGAPKRKRSLAANVLLNQAN